MYIFIPFIYLLHILPFHIITAIKLIVIENDKSSYNTNKSPMEILEDKEDTYLILYYVNTIRNIFSSSFSNPLSGQGMLILGYITNLYLIKYKWKKWS
jgi:hypothetical protein